MAPYINAHESVCETNIDVSILKEKFGVDDVKLKATAKPPVADDFMYDFKYNHALPTTDVLGVEIPADTDAQKEAQGIVDNLSNTLAKGDAQAFTDLFLDYGVWRDKLSFTWDYRTFNFKPAILKAATDLFSTTKATNFNFLTPAPKIDRPYPDYAQLQFVISFETEIVNASAVVNSVLTKDGWKIYTFHTVAEKLKQFPEVQPADGHMTGAISWEKQRAQDIDSVDPEVLIVGGGQNGLALAARLNALGMKNLIIDHGQEIGDVWKKRYEYLSLHFPHWADDLPYFPYPKHWPTYTPSQKQGIYMQWYASALELNVWTKSSVAKAEQDDQGNWTVVIDKGSEEARTIHPKQVVMATSLCGAPMLPAVPGMSDFKGTIRHSTAHDSSREFVGKKVCVIGTSSSGFDTAYFRSSCHCLEEQDRLFFATPTGPGEELSRRNAKVLEDLDRPLLEGLNAKGLRTWRGQRGTGGATLGQTRNGGFYFDAGACEHIINGNIKVESGYIEKFTADKTILSGGRMREFDLIVFATGFTNTIDSIRSTLGDKIADNVTPIWGIDDEGEFKTAYRETGVPNLWLMVGYLPYTRFHSKLLAMRLKAIKEGISPAPYKE
ncbi:hypothetical protein HG530_014726 [Fusarium avenaceum]|nr:hypothetical protein HG530_014726 [Fusarium avenaceum]